uniref:Mex-3 RNA binding family member C n=1 Tax=Sinocyclocheilus anshuiensis TaxID=1608454 RepID=A0A671Q8R2_9TELE
MFWLLNRKLYCSSAPEGERCALNTRRKSVNTTECVMVATSEHVAEIVGRQGGFITCLVTPSRDKEPVFEVTGMPENVDRAREEIEAHIAMRTAGSVDTSMDDDDFHYNGTDVGFESGGNRAWLFSGSVSNFHSNAAGYRNDSSSSLGSNSSESYYSGKGSGVADLSPGSSGGTFWFGDSQLPLGSEDPAGYDGLTMTAPSTNPQPTLWGTFERGGASLPTTPRLSPSRLSPSLPEDHPLVRLVQENSQSLPAFGSAFSPSSDSTGSSSLPDVRTYPKHSQAPACVCCGDNMAALVLGGQNLVCLECSNSILQSRFAFSCYVVLTASGAGV